MAKVLRIALRIATRAKALGDREPAGTPASALYARLYECYGPLAGFYVQYTRFVATAEAGTSTSLASDKPEEAARSVLRELEAFRSAVLVWLAIRPDKREAVADRSLGPGVGKVLDNMILNIFNGLEHLSAHLSNASPQS